MNVEIINTGTELLLGRVLNTHQQWLCTELARLGHRVAKQVAIPDDAASIQEAVAEALTRADLVITTGGLGPTSDDITRELIAELLGVPLKTDPSVMAHLERFFAARNRPVPDNALKEALVPEGAIVLQNANGTAPGLVLFTAKRSPGNGKACLVMLPGPPRELRPMFTQQVLPLLEKEFGKEPALNWIFKTTGIGEAFVEQKLTMALKELVQKGLEIGYCAAVGQVEVRLSVTGKALEPMLHEAANIVTSELGSFIFSTDDRSLEEVVVTRLIEQKRTLALAESCTGGMVASRVTDVPGASAVFLAGLVTYSNEAKEQLLGVRRETLDQHGAVSEPTAREMAAGARERNGTDYAIAITGIAGPGGGTPEKPVGTVYIALATPNKVIVEKNFNPYDRATFKYVTSQQALDLLRRNF